MARPKIFAEGRAATLNVYLDVNAADPALLGQLSRLAIVT